MAFKLTAPCQEYLFGTDELGRDIFSRIIYGTRISLLASVFAVALAMLIGITLGAIAGALGGIVDDIIMRICDIFLSFPSLLLAIVIAAFAGPSLRNALIAIAISWWPLVCANCTWTGNFLKGTAVCKGGEGIGKCAIKDYFSAYCSKLYGTSYCTGNNGFGRYYPYAGIIKLFRIRSTGTNTRVGINDKYQ